MSGAGPDRAHFFESALLALDRVAAGRLLSEAARDEDPIATVEGLLAPALERIGAAWDAGTIALSQYYMAGRICEDLVATVLPKAAEFTRAQPRIAIATLEDHHLLGKRIVLAALRASGFAVSDLGRGTVEEVAERACAERVDLLLVSTLMLPSALRVRALRERVEAGGARPTMVVGGAPFRLDPKLWVEVGADAMGSNASDAIGIVREMCGGRA